MTSNFTIKLSIVLFAFSVFVVPSFSYASPISPIYASTTENCDGLADCVNTTDMTPSVTYAVAIVNKDWNPDNSLADDDYCSDCFSGNNRNSNENGYVSSAIFGSESWSYPTTTNVCYIEEHAGWLWSDPCDFGFTAHLTSAYVFEAFEPTIQALDIDILFPEYGTMIASSSMGVIDVTAEAVVAYNSSSTMFFYSTAGQCLLNRWDTDPGVTIVQYTTECPYNITPTTLTAVIYQNGVSVSTSTLIYDVRYELVYGHTATSSIDNYVAEGCNNQTCSISDISGCFKIGMCWAFVPDNTVLDNFIDSANPLDHTIYDFLPEVNDFFVDSFDDVAGYDTLTFTLPSPSGDEDSFTIDFATMRTHSEEAEDTFAPFLYTAMSFLMLIYLYRTFYRLSGNPEMDGIIVESKGSSRQHVWLKNKKSHRWEQT